MSETLLACDWGTTHLRAWVLGDNGEVLRRGDFPLGVSRLQPGEAAARFRDEVRPQLQAQTLPAILCGMVGSTLGWTVAPYLTCPADAAALRQALVEVEPGGAGVRIVPGLKCEGLDGAAEVMRGEETQAFGWLSLQPERRRGRQLVCHPGTHAKWMIIEDGAVSRFLTAMTGELFEVLRRHSVLRTDAEPDDEAAFDLGVSAAGGGEALSTRLFTVRTRTVAGDLAPEASASYLSGLLIGSEIGSMRRLLDLKPGADVALIGDPGLTHWYARALRARGLEPSLHHGDETAIAGLWSLHQGDHHDPR